MPRRPTTRVKSEHHAELARRSIADRPRDARGRLLPRSIAPPAPPPNPGPDPDPQPAPPPAPPPDPTSARRRLPWDRRA